MAADHGLPGTNRRLGLRMTSYQPLVRCSNPIHVSPSDCDQILWSMSASRGSWTFGRLGDLGVEVALPYELANGESELI